MFVDGLKRLKKKRIAKKRDEAYSLIVDAVRTSTQPKIQIQLSGDIEMYQPMFDILYAEGYEFTTNYIPGEKLNVGLSSGIVVVDIETKRKNHT